MKKTILLFTLLLIFQNANAQWVKTAWPSVYANCLTNDNNGNLYAGLLYSGFSTAKKSGVYFSNDNGNSWTDISGNLPQLTVNTIKVVNNAIFVGTPKGRIYKSTNNGTSWEKLNTGMDTLSYVMSLESFGGEMFAGTNNSGLYISKDYGNSWQPFNSGIVGKVVNCLYTSSTDLFASMNNKYVYRYDQPNSTWKGSGNGMLNNSINALVEAIDGSGNKFLFAGLYSSVTELAVSTDNGINWTASDAGLPNVPVYTLTAVGYNIFLGNDYGVYRSTDFGKKWEDAKTGLAQFGSYTYYLTKGKTDLFVIQGGAVWKRPYSDFNITSVSNEAEIPDGFSLYQNYPNPFNPSTTIKYSILNVMVSSSNHDVTLRQSRQSRDQSDNIVTLKVYDILGKEVATLVNERQSAGNYEVKFDGSNLSSGVYFYKLQAGEFSQTKKLLLMK
ncbi:MAG: VPS10 domain-containing protein [Stygiobacter sp.]